MGRHGLEPRASAPAQGCTARTRGVELYEGPAGPPSTSTRRRRSRRWTPRDPERRGRPRDPPPGVQVNADLLPGSRSAAPDGGGAQQQQREALGTFDLGRACSPAGRRAVYEFVNMLGVARLATFGALERTESGALARSIPRRRRALARAPRPDPEFEGDVLRREVRAPTGRRRGPRTLRYRASRRPQHRPRRSVTGVLLRSSPPRATGSSEVARLRSRPRSSERDSSRRPAAPAGLFSKGRSRRSARSGHRADGIVVDNDRDPGRNLEEGWGMRTSIAPMILDVSSGTDEGGSGARQNIYPMLRLRRDAPRADRGCDRDARSRRDPARDRPAPPEQAHLGPQARARRHREAQAA